MIRISFLILVLFSSVTFAQTQEKEDHYKFFEYEKISDKLLKDKIQDFCKESIKTEWIGWVVNYGNSKRIANRNKQIIKNYTCRQEFPEPRIIYVNIEDKDKSKTEFWIVSPGLKPPVFNKDERSTNKYE